MNQNSSRNLKDSSLDTQHKLEGKNIIDFRYSGNPGDYENVSLIDVLEGNVPASAFDDCIVLVGAYAAGMMDSYFVPVDRSSQMFGVEIHANVIQAIMEGKTLENVNKVVDALISAIIIAIITFALSFAGVKIGNIFGSRYEKKAEAAGGIILILLGVKILLEHLGVL